MPCHRPSVAVVMPGKTAKGKACLKFLGSAVNFFSTNARGRSLSHRVSRDRVKILPCQQCIGCRLEKSRLWACRLMHEAKESSSSCFLTLTYDDKHLVSSLDPVRFQTFMKDLRRRLAYRDLGRIKFFAVGEYGDRSGRAHYHALIFGGPFGRDSEGSSDEEPARSGCPQWSNEHIGAVWSEGLHRISEVTFESAAYVARYALKKVTGAAARSHYGDRAPEFMRSSNGLGKAWFEKWWTDTYPSDGVWFADRGIYMPPPYYDRLLERVAPDLLARVKDERQSSRKVFETIEDYLSHSDRRLREGRVAGLRAKACLKREGVD